MLRMLDESYPAEFNGICLSTETFPDLGQHSSSRQTSGATVTASSWKWCPGSVCQRGKSLRKEWWSYSSPYLSLPVVRRKMFHRRDATCEKHLLNCFVCFV